MLDQELLALNSDWAIETGLAAYFGGRHYRLRRDRQQLTTAQRRPVAIWVRPSFDNPNDRVLRA